MLGALAMKKVWQNRRKQEGKPIDKPNLVMGAEAHVSGNTRCAALEIIRLLCIR